MDHTVCHFEIPVDDLSRAGAFYQELFGWKMTPFGGVDPIIWMAETVPRDEKGDLVRPGVNGMLIKKQHPQQPFANYILVESVDDYLAKAVSLGGEVAMSKQPVPGMGYFGYFKDTEGNIIALWEVDSTAGTS